MKLQELVLQDILLLVDVKIMNIYNISSLPTSSDDEEAQTVIVKQFGVRFIVGVSRVKFYFDKSGS